MSFKKWLFNEIADFGFDRKPEAKSVESDDPIDPIEADKIISELCRYKVGNKEPEQRWQDVVTWGESVGAIKVDISPLGSYKATVRRMIKDLQGNDRWICEFVYDFTETGVNKNEIDLAVKIHDQLIMLDKVLLPAPSNKYENLQRLVLKLASGVRTNTPDVMRFGGIKQMKENYYKIFFEYNGYGVEAPGAMRAEQFDIDVMFVEETGLIRCWGYEILSPKRVRKFDVMPSEWDEYFAPNQDTKDITYAIIQILKTY